MTDLNLTISMITLKIYVLNTTVKKRDCQIGLVLRSKQYAAYKKKYLKYKDINRSKAKGQKKIYLANNNNQKKT